MKCALLTYALLLNNGQPGYPNYIPGRVLESVKTQMKNLFIRAYGPGFEVFVDEETLDSRKCMIIGEYVVNDHLVNIQWKEGAESWKEQFLLGTLLQGQATITSKNLKKEEFSAVIQKKYPNLEDLSLSSKKSPLPNSFWIGLGAAALAGTVYLVMKAEDPKPTSSSKAGKIKRKGFQVGITF